MSVVGKCIKTGARVKVIEYGRVVPADLFQVGDTIVINLAGTDFEECGWFDGTEGMPAATHEVAISNGFFHKHKNVIVVKAHQVWNADGSNVS